MQHERILIFTKNWLGDVIFEEPFIRAVKRKFPQSYIVCVTNYRCNDILDAHPSVDEVIGFDDRKRDKGIMAKRTFISLLRGKNITKAFILHRSFSRALMIFLARIPERYGYATKRRGFLLTHSFREPKEKLHHVDYCVHMLHKAGLYVDEEHAHRYQFYFTENDKASMIKLLHDRGIESGRFVGIHPSANWEPKRWPAENFGACIDQMNEEFNLPIVITGSQEDAVVAQKIISRVTGRKPISLCGKMAIRELGALFSLSRLVISADSGPLHIASGVGVPVIALFGPTDPDMTGPRGKGKSFVIKNTPSACDIPCYDQQCSTHECMRDLSADRVIAVIKKENLL